MNKHTKLKNNIKVYRTAYQMTQTELANQIGISRNSISSIELGIYCPTAYIAYKLCKALNVKFEQLFYMEDE